MAELKPFAALRFQTGKAGQIDELTCPPYDIISEQQRLAYIAKNEHNVVRLELPKGDDPYKEAGETLRAWLDEGVLKTDDHKGIYIYEEEFEAKGRAYRVKGFITLVKLEEFSAGVVLPHEETLSKAKTDRFNLMDATGCNFSQIYSLYMDEERQTGRLIDALSNRAADICFTDAEGVTHRLWCVYDEAAIAKIGAQFAARKLYIADGHHRYETALNFSKHLKEQGVVDDGSHAANYVMMMLVDLDHDGLVVFPTHRMVCGLPSFDPEALLEACKEHFDVSAQTGLEKMESTLDELYQQGKKAFGLYTGGGDWTLLVLRDLSILEGLVPGGSEALCGLDVTVLHTLILENLLGIDKQNMAEQRNLKYTRSLSEALESVQSGRANCSFLLNPTRVSEIKDVAAAGEKMPQKSTYFYPKLITGLVMNKFM